MARGVAPISLRPAVADDRAFATGVRDGSLQGDHVVQAMAESVVDKLRVANPRWFV